MVASVQKVSSASAPRAGSCRHNHKRICRKRCKSGIYCEEISLETLLQLVHLPSHKAANALGLGITVFKRLCRLRGLSKWPYVKQLSAKPNSSPQGVYQELSPNSSNTCQTRSETCSPGTSTSPHSSQELQSFVEDGCPAPLVIPTPSSSFRQGCSGWDKLEALLAVTEQVQCGTAWQQTQDNSEKYHPSPAYKSAFEIVGSGRLPCGRFVHSQAPQLPYRESTNTLISPGFASVQQQEDSKQLLTLKMRQLLDTFLQGPVSQGAAETSIRNQAREQSPPPAHHFDGQAITKPAPQLEALDSNRKNQADKLQRNEQWQQEASQLLSRHRWPGTPPQLNSRQFYKCQSEAACGAERPSHLAFALSNPADQHAQQREGGLKGIRSQAAQLPPEASWHAPTATPAPLADNVTEPYRILPRAVPAASPLPATPAALAHLLGTHSRQGPATATTVTRDLMRMLRHKQMAWQQQAQKAVGDRLGEGAGAMDEGPQAQPCNDLGLSAAAQVVLLLQQQREKQMRRHLTAELLQKWAHARGHWAG